MSAFRPSEFRRQASAALRDETLHQALGKAKSGFVDKRLRAIELVPEFELLRDEARDIKNACLDRLDELLIEYETNVTKAGGHVHWAETPEDACSLIAGICTDAGERKVLKGKSMAGEEVRLNEALEHAGLEPIETDLGEYIIQLAEEPPSHIIAPAVHKTKQQISDLFSRHHDDLNEQLTEVGDLVNEARRVLRSQFLSSDVGITGANLLIAETGTHMLVTNEGNGDLSSTLPRVHIVIAGIEKCVATLEQAATITRVLARSSTGQPITSYTSFFTGPKRPDDIDGPEEFHVVLLDNGRSDMLGGDFHEMLRCIRCGACLNHCPVYASIGGHAYGGVYPGPMGSVLTPLQWGLREAKDLPNACTLNGRCGSVCPVRIPLPTLLRRLREKIFEQQLDKPSQRTMLRTWGWLAARPGLYQFVTRWGIPMMKLWFRGRSNLKSMPMAGAWTAARDLPAPQGGTFMHRYRAERSA